MKAAFWSSRSGTLEMRFLIPLADGDLQSLFLFDKPRKFDNAITKVSFEGDETPPADFWRISIERFANLEIVKIHDTMCRWTMCCEDLTLDSVEESDSLKLLGFMEGNSSSLTNAIYKQTKEMFESIGCKISILGKRAIDLNVDETDLHRSGSCPCLSIFCPLLSARVGVRYRIFADRAEVIEWHFTNRWPGTWSEAELLAHMQEQRAKVQQKKEAGIHGNSIDVNNSLCA